MTDKRLCEMCTEYSADNKCDHKDKCELLGILKEDRRLKEKLREIKKERDKLSMEKSWKNNPERMGR